jgi:anti-sigma regulatory factor (Ser/Thr protein kinase)
MCGERAPNRVVLDREYDGATRTLQSARSDVLDCLRPYVADTDVQERAQLVVSELATNAIQASPGRSYRLRVSLVAGGSVEVEVTSSTGHETPPPRDLWGPATAVAPKGRGLMIVGKLTDEVGVEQPVAGTVVVTATFRSALGA